MPTGDTAAAVAWLLALRPAGPWFLYSADSTEKEIGLPARRFTSEQVDAMRAWIDERQGRYNLYYSPNTPLPTVGKHPTKAEMTHINVLHVDLDLPKTGLYSAPTPENLARLRARIDVLEPTAHLLVFSGGGYQGLWNVDRALPAAEYTERIEAINQGIEKACGGDHCWNVNRILRLPGTLNTPSPTKLAKNPHRVPALATVVRADWDARWSFERDIAPRAIPTVGYDDPLVEEDDEQADDAPRSTGREHTLDALPRKVQRAIKTGDASAYRGDRSRLVLFVLAFLIRAGWTDEEMTPFILDPAYPLSAHILENKAISSPARAAQRQIDRARALVKVDWVYNDKGGILPHWPANIRKGIDLLGIRFMHDTFADQPYINGAGPVRPLTDAESNSIRVNLFPETHNFVPGKDIWTDVIGDLAWQASYHPILDYLNDIKWDGVPRLDTWLVDYGGVKVKVAADMKESPAAERAHAAAQYNAYVRAAGRLMLMAAVRRVRQPGCKFDEMMVFVNIKQGTNKSQALAILAVNKDWFLDSLPLHAKDQEVIEKLAGKWIVEFAELVGLRNSEVEHLKAFLSRDTEHARAAYGHFTKHPKRQCVFFASTNEPTFLKDTEDRRFWPIVVGIFDLAALLRDRDQLWAEAAAAEAAGESIRLDPSLWDAAAAVQAEHRIEDPWVALIQDQVGDLNGSIPALAAWLLVGKPGYQRVHEDNRRFGAAMRTLGWEREVAYLDGRTVRCWQRGTPEERRAVIYVVRDPVTGDISVGHEPGQAAVVDPAAYEPDENLPF